MRHHEHLTCRSATMPSHPCPHSRVPALPQVLARAEDGSQHPSCSFVRPLQLGRAVPTPLHAARLVALLRRRDDDAESLSAAVLGPGSESAAAAAAQSECWCCLHTVLASRSASAEEQALLLCGLLLGFGLDAYVAVGRAKAMAAARGGGGGGAGAGAGHGAIWVVTRGAFAETTHWDPGSGQRFSSLEAAACPFATVGSVFNHCGVWANAQPDDGATSCSYLLEEPSLWHALAVDAAEMPGPGWCVTFAPHCALTSARRVTGKDEATAVRAQVDVPSAAEPGGHGRGRGAARAAGQDGAGAPPQHAAAAGAGAGARQHPHGVGRVARAPAHAGARRLRAGARGRGLSPSCALACW